MSSPDPDIATTLQQILHNQHDINTKASDINTLRSRIPPSGFSASQQETSGLHQITNTSIKLDIPRFNGTEPMSWIFKINQFFDFHQTVENQRLRIASFYMEGEALTWYQWMHENGELTSWPRFLHALELCFAPSQFDDPKGALFKLCQTTTVKAYQAEFEALANRIVGLPHQFYLNCFIYGLKPDIRRENAVEQPPKFVGRWVGTFVINVFIVVWVLIVGFGFGGWASMVNFVHQIDTFGLFTKCYQCPPPTSSLPIMPPHQLNATAPSPSPHHQHHH